MLVGTFSLKGFVFSLERCNWRYAWLGGKLTRPPMLAACFADRTFAIALGFGQHASIKKARIRKARVHVRGLHTAFFTHLYFPRPAPFACDRDLCTWGLSVIPQLHMYHIQQSWSRSHERILLRSALRSYMNVRQVNRTYFRPVSTDIHRRRSVVLFGTTNGRTALPLEVPQGASGRTAV